MSVPTSYSERLIHDFLQDKLVWINQQRERILNTQYPQDETLQTGSTIEFLGSNYLLIIEPHNGPSQILIKDQLIHCYTSKTTPEQIKVQIDQWYRREMESLLPTRIKHWEDIIGVKINEWGIKKMKTRWGSCNPRAARIWLSLNLVKKPIVCLEYVLVHELIHLLERAHNKRFYSLMTQFMPLWREHQLTLEGKSRRFTR